MPVRFPAACLTLAALLLVGGLALAQRPGADNHAPHGKARMVTRVYAVGDLVIPLQNDGAMRVLDTKKGSAERTDVAAPAPACWSTRTDSTPPGGACWSAPKTNTQPRVPPPARPRRAVLPATRPWRTN
jgi:hypothetical protein